METKLQYQVRHLKEELRKGFISTPYSTDLFVALVNLRDGQNEVDLDTIFNRFADLLEEIENRLRPTPHVLKPYESRPPGKIEITNFMLDKFDSVDLVRVLQELGDPVKWIGLQGRVLMYPNQAILEAFKKLGFEFVDPNEELKKQDAASDSSHVDAIRTVLTRCKEKHLPVDIYTEEVCPGLFRGYITEIPEEDDGIVQLVSDIEQARESPGGSCIILNQIICVISKRT